ncbi:MAG: 4'-phosphopantetheinyl transferase superfamily protein [Paludibacteraceae bacterium]|nr:4'-phosphopantetheinyl transferase superfamily protein [Paludibacteraceae bacterium]
MLISFFDTSRQSDAAIAISLHEFLPQIPEERRAEALRYKSERRQYDCVKSFRMLEELLGISLPAWQVSEHGKPYYEPAVIQSLLSELPETRLSEMQRRLLENDGQLHFSLSHCSRAIAVALSERPVGIDVETVERHVTEELVRYTMNNAEQACIFGHAVDANRHLSPATTERFITLWTQKEAYLKMLGTGINSDMKDVLINITDNVKLTTTAYPETGVILSVAEQNA